MNEPYLPPNQSNMN